MLAPVHNVSIALVLASAAWAQSSSLPIERLAIPLVKVDAPAGTSVMENGGLGFTFELSAGTARVKITRPTRQVVGLGERVDDVLTCTPESAGRCDPSAERPIYVLWNAPNDAFVPNAPIDFTYPGLLAEARYPLAWPAFMRTDHATKAAGTHEQRDMDVHAHGERITCHDDVYVVHHGDPSALLTPARPDEQLAALEAFARAEPVELTSPLRELHALHAPLEFVTDVDAAVTTTFYVQPDDGEPHELTRRHKLFGTIAGDGRFRVDHTRTARCEGETTEPLTELLAFDGATFFQGSENATYFNAFVSTSKCARPLRAAHTLLVRPLIEWARSPFGIERATGISRRVEQAADGATLVVETYAWVRGGENSFVTRYVLEPGATPRVRTIEVTGEAGELMRRTEFGDYRELAPGTWRPFRIVEHAYDVGRLSATTTTVIRGAVVSRGAAFAPLKGHTRWFVHV